MNTEEEKEKRRQYLREWKNKPENKERYRQKGKEYRERNKEAEKERAKRQYNKNKEYYKRKHNEYHLEHRDEILTKNKARYQKNKSQVAEKYQKDRLLCLEHYGNKCVCCGESRFQFLALDHKNDDGSKHREKIGSKIVQWLLKNNFPSDFEIQILCHNCNMAKSIYGKCPHELERDT